jgi:hypothetical protein
MTRVMGWIAPVIRRIAWFMWRIPSVISRMTCLIPPMLPAMRPMMSVMGRVTWVIQAMTSVT